MPASAVKTTSDITRGFMSSKKSPTDGSNAERAVADFASSTQPLASLVLHLRGASRSSPLSPG